MSWLVESTLCCTYFKGFLLPKVEEPDYFATVRVLNQRTKYDGNGWFSLEIQNPAMRHLITLIILVCTSVAVRATT